MTDGQWDPGKDFAMVTARETGPTKPGGGLTVCSMLGTVLGR